ncbi:MAG TPA: HAD family hydrolase [Myxococcales bacterium]|nr:HAD family hydrolase [Myxococcales bacterium]
MLDAVIFDLDGTLVDTPQVIVETAIAALRASGALELAMPEPQAIRATIGLPLTVAFSGLLGRPAESAEVQTVVEEYRRLWRANVIPRSADLLYPGVPEGVQVLRDLGLRLAVATSKVQTGAVAQLEAAGIARHFEVVAGYDAVERPKPDPQLALHVLERLGATPARTIVVGDTTHDLLMARGAGLRALAVTYGAQDEATLLTESPEFLAHDFPEVVAVVRRLAGK